MLKAAEALEVRARELRMVDISESIARALPAAWERLRALQPERATTAAAAAGTAKDGETGEQADEGEGYDNAAADDDNEVPAAASVTACAADVVAATHMLLVLNKETFVDEAGDQLAEEVRAARMANLPVLLLHDKNACEFSLFFQTTPQDLISDGLYNMVALELPPPPHDLVTAVHLARAVGARTRGVGLLGDLSQSRAKRAAKVVPASSGEATVVIHGASSVDEPLDHRISRSSTAGVSVSVR